MRLSTPFDLLRVLSACGRFQGVIPLSYVIEIAILPWADRDRTLHPYYLTESGRCYVRRQASIVLVRARVWRLQNMDSVSLLP